MTVSVLTSRSRRRVVLPVITLVIAGAIAWWSTQQRTQHLADVQAFVERLCVETRNGTALDGTIAPHDRLTEQAIIEQLRRVCAASPVIRVSAGDVANIGRTQGAANHTAIFQIAGQDSLGLRVQHNGNGNQIQIVGYWIP